MSHFLAIIHKESAFGVQFPDVPGCFSAGETIEAAIENAAQALRFHFEESSEAPPFPREAEALRADPEIAAELQAGAVLAAVPFLRNDAPTKRYNLSFRTDLADAIDRKAKAKGMNRSSYLASLAERDILGAEDGAESGS